MQQLHKSTTPGRAAGDCGIEADVVVVDTLEELMSQGQLGHLQDKIVVAVEDWEQGYGYTNRFRRGTWNIAGQFGAVGALIRSVAPWGLSNPHTGSAAGPNGTTIPTASIAISDAHVDEWLAR